MRPNGNGWLRAAMSALFLLLLGAVGWAWTSTTSRAVEVEQRVQEHGERLSRTEAEHIVLKAWLDRVERKLDRVLEQRGLR